MKNLIQFLETKEAEKVFYCLSEVIQLQENEMVSDIEILRTGVIRDRDWKITSDMLNDYVKNFKDNTYGTEVQVNCEHRRGSEAAGWVQDVYIDGNKLMCKVEWTEMGAEKIKKKLFKFVSAELAYEYPHYKTGDLTKNVFIGLALTNTPALKRQKALELDEEQIKEHQLLINTNMFKKLLETLKERKIVTKADKEMVKKLLAELPADEQEEVKTDVEAVDAKPEAEETKPAEGGENLADKAKVADLTEQLATKVKKSELKEQAVSKYLISKDRKVGLQTADLSEVVDFTASLSADQLTKFDNLFNKVRAADLGVIGSTKSGEELSEDQKIAEADKEAEELAQNTKRDLGDCKAEVYKKKGLA